MNKNNRVVNYTLSGLIPHSQHIVRVTADSTATDTVPEELAHLHSLNITVRTLPDGEGLNSHHIVVRPSHITSLLPYCILHLLPPTPISSSPVPGKGSPPLLSSALYTDSITITLVAPEYPNGVVIQYNIRWYREGQEDSAQVVTVPGTQQSYTLSGLTPGTYFIQVRVSNEINYRKIYNRITT